MTEFLKLFKLLAAPRVLGPVYMKVGDPKVGEVTCGKLPHLTCKRDHIKMRDYLERRVTPPKRVTSPTWSPPPPCKQAVKDRLHHLTVTIFRLLIGRDDMVPRK